MAGSFQARTDLALELRENIDKSDSELSGVIVNRQENETKDITVTSLEITNEKGSKAMGKPIGTYVTIEAPGLSYGNETYHHEVAQILTKYIKERIDSHKKRITVLVTGLGNKEITPDALGPLVVENLFINNHIDEEKEVALCGIVPGVMAQTGFETASIIKGIVKENKVDYVIAIDALAARNTSRLNTTIQISDTGITPGSGVGNHRNAINGQTIGVPVLAIGVPTVIDTPTIVNDTMNNLLEALEESGYVNNLNSAYVRLNDAEKYQLIKEVINPEMSGMYVTPKDIDESIKRISYTISEAINNIC